MPVPLPLVRQGLAPERGADSVVNGAVLLYKTRIDLKLYISIG
jgi:hypothetical protein